MAKRFGLIGLKVGHSFSKAYFDEKFFREGLMDYRYELYPMPEVGELKKLLNDNPDIVGLNVTIPYKEQVMPLLNEIDSDAASIGAVNVIQVKGDKLKGFNTDSIAFYETLQHWKDKLSNQRALILGTGGSSKAVQKALEKMRIPYESVTRGKGKAKYKYEELKNNPSVIQSHRLIINTTPLGMSPDTNSFPDIPYEQLGPDHLIYDLIYNPARTQFLQKAEMRGCAIKNGLEMLHIQAEKSWEIWNA